MEFSRGCIVFRKNDALKSRFQYNVILKKMKLHLIFFPNSIYSLILKKDCNEVLEIIHIEYTDYSILKTHCQMLTLFTDSR